MISQKALFRLSHGLYVIGVKDVEKERWTGCTVDSIMQATQTPVTIFISCNKQNYTTTCLKQQKEFSLSVLSEKVDPYVIANFGFQSGKSISKWDLIEKEEKWDFPFVPNSSAYLKCKVLKTEELSTHILFQCEVLLALEDNFESITYWQYQKDLKDEVIQAFKSKQSKKKEKTMDTKTIWVCSVCGYVYDGDVPFEELPEDYVCPVCLEPKSAFEQQEA